MSSPIKSTNPIMIIGGSDNTSLMIELARIKAENHKLEVVTIEEAQEKGFVQNIPYKAPPILPLGEYIVTDNSVRTKSARNIRREKSRKSKKRK